MFRLNIAVGRTEFEELIGHPPAAHADRAALFDYTALDRLIPHPIYAAQGWVAILNPGTTTTALVRALLSGAHTGAVRRHRRRRE